MNHRHVTLRQFRYFIAVAESGSVRRFTVEADLEAGGRYRLVANATARNCEAVELIGDRIWWPSTPQAGGALREDTGAEPEPEPAAGG